MLKSEKRCRLRFYCKRSDRVKMFIEIKKCTPEDLHTLREISFETFNETSTEQNSPENMNAYVEKAFMLEKAEKELSNSASSFFFIYSHNELAVYLDVNRQDGQCEDVE